MLSNKMANEIGITWLESWNHQSLDQYQLLYDEEAIEVSSLANRLIFESHGQIQGKRSLLYFWEIIRLKLPNYKYQLQNVTYYKSNIIVYFTILAFNSTGIAKISINDSNKINKIVISHI